MGTESFVRLPAAPLHRQSQSDTGHCPDPELRVMTGEAHTAAAVASTCQPLPLGQEGETCGSLCPPLQYPAGASSVEQGSEDGGVRRLPAQCTESGK